MFYILVIIFIIIVLCCIFVNPKDLVDLLLTKCKPLKQAHVHSNFDALRDDLTYLHRHENQLLFNQINKLIDTFESEHNDDVKEIKSNISELRIVLNNILNNQKMLLSEIDSLLQKECNTIAHNNSKMRTEINNSIFPIRMYSEMIDSTVPLGFSNDKLKSTSIGCAFIIQLIDEKNGTFQFVDDPNIQMEILSAFNPIVTDSSEYGSVPASPAKIIIVEPGMLYLENNIWLIKKKQIIKFA